MTERSESERAELVALEEKFESVCGKTMVATLRRLTAQDQKPVAWRILCTDKSRGSTGYYYTEQLPFEPGENIRQRSEPEHLYLSPPPAAGWDEAIEAIKFAVEEISDPLDKHEFLQLWLLGGLTRTNWPEFFSTRATPAATKSYGARVLRQLTDDEHNRIANAALASGTVVGSLPDHGGADAGVGRFQSRVQPWMMACFGPEISADRIERNRRFLEEALELVQSNGCTQSEAHQLVDYVYGRPQGEINQEVGGVMVTLAALCLANGIDMHECGETELARIWTKVEKIRAKHAAKPKQSPLPGPSAPAPVAANASAEARLREALERELSGNSGQLLDIVASAIRGDGSDLCDGDWVSLSEDQKEGWRGDANRALAAIKEYLIALSAHPHASDCDKQGTTKSEASSHEKRRLDASGEQTSTGPETSISPVRIIAQRHVSTPSANHDVTAGRDRQPNASAEARLREALQRITGFIRDFALYDQKYALESVLKISDEALSAHHHTSDCDKQGER